MESKYFRVLGSSLIGYSNFLNEIGQNGADKNVDKNVFKEYLSKNREFHIQILSHAQVTTYLNSRFVVLVSLGVSICLDVISIEISISTPEKS
jgi:hypothetical protein